MSDFQSRVGFSPEFRAALAKEIDRMGTTLAAACALRAQIDGEDAELLPSVASFAQDRKRKPREAKAAIKLAPKRAAISPEQLASRQVQGRYPGLIRQFPKRGRGAFQTLAREKSREAAITAMERALRGRGKPKPKARRRSKPALGTANDSSPSSSPAES